MDHWLTLENRLKSDNWCDEQASRDNWNKEKNIYNYYISREKKTNKHQLYCTIIDTKRVLWQLKLEGFVIFFIKIRKMINSKRYKEIHRVEINFLINKEPTGN